MSDRLASRFRSCAREDRAALITFVTAGDPTPEASRQILPALVAGGADVIELGMPFTDPMADGPAIQAASLRSLRSGMTLTGVFDLVRDFRKRDTNTPIVLMGYFNPIFSYGVDRFAADAKQAGVDGVIIVDVPPEEDEEVSPLRAHGLHVVRLATPTTDNARLPAVLERASGFLYYVSVAGVTGTRSAESANIENAVRRLKQATDLPVAVGFGIKTPEQAAAVGAHADGVVVGSAIVSLIGEAAGARANDIADRVREFVRALADGVHGARRAERAEVA